MNYHIVTFGCQMNEADSELMASLLVRSGWQAAATRDEADLVLINTCSVRERPEQKAFSLLGELREWKAARAGRVLGVTGCMAQRAAAEILRRAPHVDLLMGTRALHRVEEFVLRARAGATPVVAVEMDGDPSSARPMEEDTPAALRAFVPIIRGCSNFCSYCIVPDVRGPEASRPASEIVAEVESLVRRGAREVTLLGQNVLAYGRDLAEDCGFADLLRRLDGIDDLWRIRFTTCHPRDVDANLVSAMAGCAKVCEHIHLPIQAGTDRLLMEMNRGYTVEHYLRIVGELRSRVPGIATTTDMLVGFPGETEGEFETSLRLYERTRFDAAFMFAYSPRPGTRAAAQGDQVPREVRIARLNRLIEMQNRVTIEKNQAQIGELAEVLVDGPAPRGEGLLAGRARSNKQVILAGEPSLKGLLVSVRLTEGHLWGFRGELRG